MKIGIVAFGMPPVYNRSVKASDKENVLAEYIKKIGYEITDVQITAAADLEHGISKLKQAEVDCLVFDLKHWGRNSLIVNLARRMDLPLGLFCRTKNGYSGITITTSVSGILRESDTSKNVNRHQRFTDNMIDELRDWLKAVEIKTDLRKSRVLCWGGSYGADMPYTRSYADGLENLFIAEVMTESESVLINRAENIIKSNPERIQNFLTWADGKGVKVERDKKMVTEQSLKKQVALYLASRDRLEELADENIQGVSIKCHFELSITGWGCTACMLPAFLPFGEDCEGRRSIVPVACEGDLNGLAGIVLLKHLNRDVPPLFGDFVEYRDDYVLMRNCGSSSVFWAGLSDVSDESLCLVAFRPNMHGKTGAAVSYETPAAEAVTVFRLFIFRGEFHAVFGKARIVGQDEHSSYPDPWPHTRLDFDVDNSLLFKVFPCNHASLTLGDQTAVLENFCRLSGLKYFRCDSDTQMSRFLDEISGTAY